MQNISMSFYVSFCLKKMYMTVPSTSNKWNSSPSFLLIYFWGYNPHFGSNKIRFYFFFVVVVV